MFLEKRVYQGSSGRVYPLPCTDRIAEKAQPIAWDAIFLENEFVQVMLLPALGGRIHRLLDKTNGYDAIYYQPVIKPALVGLAGPWASGGIEFNWPQHHRPSTFMPTDVAIEEHPDGSATVWMSEHDPLVRMKGMHGVRVRPGKSYLELVARVHNRTADVQTFLWWANVATRVHEEYQSFFPPDVTFVADHAKRATDTYPLSSGRYYGVDYAARARRDLPENEKPPLFVPPPGRYAPNDLSWYANIPVPTSYMAMGSQENFVGGYDHRAHAGLVHVANHHISPGKKQWTWGNQAFGYAWDRNLTEPDENGIHAPYIELMSGVYTDNQPDFSYLQPGETKTWSQFWYPLREIGPVQQANPDAAVSLLFAGGQLRVGVAVTGVHPAAIIQLEFRGKPHATWTRSLAPDSPFTADLPAPRGAKAEHFTLTVSATEGTKLIAYTPAVIRRSNPPAPASEPLPPPKVSSADELFFIGLHLEQYRHATRSPELYWREALRRDSGDARCHLALGRWHLRRGELAEAETHLRASIARLTSRNPNPAEGEAHYQLGRCLRWQAFATTEKNLRDAKLHEAYAALYKATWNHAWQAAGYHALAEIDVLRRDWTQAHDHLRRALRLDLDRLGARNLQVIVLRQLGRIDEAEALLRETRALDPLDWWARHLQGETLTCDVQVRLDLALDYARAGLFAEALAVLADAKPTERVEADTLPDASLGTEPLLHYYRAWISSELGDEASARQHRHAAANAPLDYCFPARLEEIFILRHAMSRERRDARAPFYLANLLYDRRRQREAIPLWERAVQLEPENAVAWRNLGIAYFNIQHRPAAARRAYERALRAAPADARLLYERDQLWKRLGVAPERRLKELQRRRALVDARDDLSVELCALLNQTGQPEAALAVIRGRKFQPWEGGEGLALGQHRRTHLVLGRKALEVGELEAAIDHFRSALAAPENLGEAKHLLANQSDLHFWLATALDAAGKKAEARQHWKIAAESKGDFQTMSVRAYSEMTYFSARSLEQLGRKSTARKTWHALLAYARSLATAPATIDYFATSLPTMLLFDDDLAARQRTTALFLEAQARLGLRQNAAARRLLQQVLQRDPNHAGAADLRKNL